MYSRLLVAEGKYQTSFKLSPIAITINTNIQSVFIEDKKKTQF